MPFLLLLLLGAAAAILAGSSKKSSNPVSPLPPPSPPPPPPPPTQSKTLIGAEDTPVSIANRFGLTLEEFIRLNPNQAFGLIDNYAHFFNLEGSPPKLVGYTPTGKMDVIFSIAVFKRDVPNPISNLSFFIRSRGEIIPSSNNGRGIGKIYTTDDGKARYVKTWVEGFPVNIK